MDPILSLLIAYAAGMVTGKVLEGWLWRSTADDFAVRVSLGARYSVRRVL